MQHQTLILSSMILLSALFIISCTQQNIDGNVIADTSIVKIVQCGNSEPCFEEHVKTCTPASATITVKELVYKEDVLGYEDDNCLIKVQYLKSPIADFEGKEMTCRIGKDYLDNFKERIGGPNMIKYCSGSMIDYIMESQRHMSNAAGQY